MWIYLALVLFPASLIRADLAQDLHDTTEYYCGLVPAGFVAGSVNSSILASLVGKTNYIDAVLFDPDCADITACVTKYQTDLILSGVRVGSPIILAILSVLVWILMSMCVCCRCCRRCSLWCCLKENSFPSYFSKTSLIVVWTLVSAFTVGLVADAIVAGVTLTSFKHGAHATLCGAISFADYAVNGAQWNITLDNGTVDAHAFVGTGPLNDTLIELSSALAYSSPTMVKVRAAVHDTRHFDNAVNQFEGYLDLMERVLGDETNRAVGGLDCALCVTCCVGENNTVSLFRAAFATSVASNLRALRVSLDEQLTGSGLTNIQDAVSNGASFVGDVASLVEDNVGSVVMDNKATVDLVLKILFAVLTALIASVALPILIAGIVVWTGVVRSKQASYSDPEMKPRSSCCSASGWCCSLWFLVLFFFVGGLLLLVGYVEASVCVAGDDMDGFIDRIKTKLGGSDSETTDSIIDTCLKSTGDGNILDAITVDGGRTAYDVLSSVEGLSTDLMNAVSGSSSNMASISTNAEFQVLLDSMQRYAGIYMLSAENIVAHLADSVFTPGGSLPNNGDREAAFGSIATCSAPPTVDLTGNPTGEWIQASLTAAGVPNPNSATYSLKSSADLLTAAPNTLSWKPASCSSPLLDSLHQTDAMPWSQIFYWQQQTRAKNDFKCDELSPLANTDGSITYMTSVQVCADLTAFSTYIGNLRNNLLQAAELVDQTSSSASAAFNTELQTALETAVLTPVRTVLDGADCSVLRKSWDGLYQAMCWVLAPSFVSIVYALIAAAGLTWLGTLAMFLIWRQLRDNLSLWTDLVTEREDRNNSIRDVVAPSDGVQLAPLARKNSDGVQLAPLARNSSIRDIVVPTDGVQLDPLHSDIHEVDKFSDARDSEPFHDSH